MEIKVRELRPSDLTALIRLLKEFAEFENLTEYCTVTEERLKAALYDKGSVVHGLLALNGETPVGYALFYPNFSSFRGECGFHLDDIYITRDFRGKGAGLALLREVARIAARRGFERIDFNVLNWNTTAVEFYKKLGAVCNPEETHFKFSGDAFVELAR